MINLKTRGLMYGNIFHVASPALAERCLLPLNRLAREHPSFDEAGAMFRTKGDI